MTNSFKELTLLLVVLLAGCGQESRPLSPEAAEQLVHGNGQHMLGIVGFNYTNQSIRSFTIDGEGGDSASLSTPSAGGSREVCCLAWADETPLPAKVKVRWANDVCGYTSEPNIYGETVEDFKWFYREELVSVRGPIPPRPTKIGAHFYPDGHVEVWITAGLGEPRLKLERTKRDPIRRCTPEDLAK